MAWNHLNTRIDLRDNRVYDNNARPWDGFYLVYMRTNNMQLANIDLSSCIGSQSDMGTFDIASNFMAGTHPIITGNWTNKNSCKTKGNAFLLSSQSKGLQCKTLALTCLLALNLRFRFDVYDSISCVQFKDFAKNGPQLFNDRRRRRCRCFRYSTKHCVWVSTVRA